MKKSLFLLLVILFLPVQVFAGGISVDYPGAPGPLFQNINWAPGDSVSKTVTVTNNNDVSQRIGFKVESTSIFLVFGSLANMITLEVRDNSSGNVLQTGTLTGIAAAGELELGILAPGTQTKYDFSAYFSLNAGNEYQGLSESFDITIGFISPASVPAPAGGIIAGIRRTLGITSEGIVEQPIIAQEGVIAGVADQEKPQDKEDRGSGVAGLRTCPWWAVVAIALAVILILYGFYLEKDEFKHRLPRFWYIWPIIFGIGAWIVHYLLHQGYKATLFCDWFWLVVLIEVTLAYIFYAFIIKEAKEETEKPRMPF